MLSYPLINLEIQKYYQNKPKLMVFVPELIHLK